MARLGINIFGDASSLKRALKESEQALRGFGKSTDEVSAGFGRSRIAGIRLRSSLVPAAGALVVAAQASRELAQSLTVTGASAATASGRFSNFGAQILSGNFIGAIKAAATQAEATGEDLLKLASASEKAGNQAQIDGLKAAASSLGWKKLQDQLKEVSTQVTATTSEIATLGVQATISAAAARTGLSSVAASAATVGERDTRFGRGPGAIAEERARRSGTPFRTPTFGLSQQLLTALAGARAGGDKGNQLAQLRRAKAALERQRPVSDKDREGVFNAIVSINSEISSLTKTTTKTVVAHAKKIKERVKKVNVDLAAAARRAADLLRQSALDKLDSVQSARDVSRALVDTKEALARARQGGGKFGIREATRDREDALLARQRLRATGTTFTGSGSTITIIVNGDTDPEVTARRVVDKLNRQSRRDTSIPGGRTPGFRPF